MEIILKWLNYSLEKGSSPLLVFENENAENEDVKKNQWKVSFDTMKIEVIDQKYYKEITSFLNKYPNYISKRVNCVSCYLGVYYTFKDDQLIQAFLTETNMISE